MSSDWAIRGGTSQIGTKDDFAHGARKDGRPVAAAGLADNYVHCEDRRSSGGIVLERIESERRDVDDNVASGWPIGQPTPTLEREIDLAGALAQRNLQGGHRLEPQDTVSVQSMPMLKPGHGRHSRPAEAIAVSEFRRCGAVRGQVADPDEHPTEHAHVIIVIPRMYDVSRAHAEGGAQNRLQVPGTVEGRARARRNRRISVPLAPPRSRRPPHGPPRAIGR